MNTYICSTIAVFTEFLRQRFLLLLLLVLLSFTSGCGDFFKRKPTELEARAILKELSQVKENTNINNPLPDMYLAPPKKLQVGNGIKLFYFTKHHPADKLAKLITDQFATKPVGLDDKRERIPGYDVSSSPATNQLVIQCPDDAEADTILAFLELSDVPPIQVNIDCLILERFGDETMDWETSLLIENFLGEEITLGEARGTFGNTGVLTDLAAAFPGASLRESQRSTFGLDFGYWLNQGMPGHQVRTIVDLLISRGYLKILLNPTLETVNGKKATVTIKDFAPIEQTVTAAGVEPYSITNYEWVEDTLTVTPHVFADGSIGLTTSIKIGSRSKPEGVVQTAIITERSIDVEENRIQPGKSLIIGGMRKSEKRSVIRGVPFFQDIPLIGVLFSSKDFEEKATEIVFILTPTISAGGVENAEIVADIRKKHAPVEYEVGLGDVLTDPFTGRIHKEQAEKKATEAESQRVKAQIEVEEKTREVVEVKEQLAETEQQLAAHKAAAEKALNEAKAAAKKAQDEARTFREAAQKAQAQAQQAAKKAVEEQEKARKAQQQVDDLKAETEKKEDTKF